MSGYSDARYAESLAAFGTPHHLSQCGAWILKRRIPGFPAWDAMGCYPLFCCERWSQLYNDLAQLEGRLVSLSAVVDPFGDYAEPYLRQCFPHLVIPFKQHFVVDLASPLDSYVHPHHRRYAKRALRAVDVERCPEPCQWLDEWTRLYSVLIDRHNIRGLRTFSKSAFAKQLQIPGAVLLRAAHGGSTLGMTIWYVDRGVAYYHLGAYSEDGYKMRASYALFWSAIELFSARGVRWLNLGAGAGVESSGTDGLTRFKRGWSTGTRTAYFCGRILDQARYTSILEATGAPSTGYFPAYRQGEFGG